METYKVIVTLNLLCGNQHRMFSRSITLPVHVPAVPGLGLFFDLTGNQDCRRFVVTTPSYDVGSDELELFCDEDQNPNDPDRDFEKIVRFLEESHEWSYL